MLSQVWTPVINKSIKRANLIVASRKRRTTRCDHMGKRVKDMQQTPQVHLWGPKVKLKFK